MLSKSLYEMVKCRWREFAREPSACFFVIEPEIFKFLKGEKKKFLYINKKRAPSLLSAVAGPLVFFDSGRPWGPLDPVSASVAPTPH